MGEDSLKVNFPFTIYLVKHKRIKLINMSTDRTCNMMENRILKNLNLFESCEKKLSYSMKFYENTIKRPLRGVATRGTIPESRHRFHGGGDTQLFNLFSRLLFYFNIVSYLYFSPAIIVLWNPLCTEICRSLGVLLYVVTRRSVLLIRARFYKLSWVSLTLALSRTLSLAIVRNGYILLLWSYTK